MERWKRTACSVVTTASLASAAILAAPTGTSAAPGAPDPATVATPSTTRPPWMPPDYSAVVPTGPYRTVRSGTTAGVRWRLLRAPGSIDTTCWRLVTRPALKIAGTNGPQGARCLPDVPGDADPVDVPQFVASSAPGSRVGYVVVHAPKGTRMLRYGTVGNRFHKVTGTGPFVVLDRAVPLWVDLRLRSGTELSCQAGAIMDRADLADATLWRNSIGQAWFCDSD